MAMIKPFHALYYNQKKIKNLSSIFVPPYDVISEKERKEFFKKSPFNFARIILGKDPKWGYEKVAGLFNQWQKKGILILDQNSSFYVWEQKFYDENQRLWLRRKQLVALVSLDDFDRGKVLPHENTLDAPKKDRLEIFKACDANLSPVFMMYEDKKHDLMKKILRTLGKPMIQTRDSGGIWNTLWRVVNPKLQDAITGFFQHKKLYIVDGHHRFATARAYAEFKNEKQPRSPYHFVMTALTNMHDAALVIDPIYRATCVPMNQNKYLNRLSKYFNITYAQKMPTLKKHEWGIRFHGETRFILLKLKNLRKTLKDLSGHESVKELDVYILHQLIIPKKMQKQIEYIRGRGKDLNDALYRLKKGELKVLWFLKEATAQQVKKVADTRHYMPPKSTYFYPKILSGPLIRTY